MRGWGGWRGGGDLVGEDTGLLVRMCDGCVCVCRLKAPPCVIEEGPGGGALESDSVPEGRVVVHCGGC